VFRCRAPFHIEGGAGNDNISGGAPGELDSGLDADTITGGPRADLIAAVKEGPNVRVGSRLVSRTVRGTGVSRWG
jgi:hypothetical protein